MMQNMLSDKIEHRDGHVLQHGPLNDRVYVMKIDPDNVSELIDYINILTDVHGYSKVFAKVPASSGKIFYTNKFHREALIPRYYLNGNDCVFLSRFSQPELAVKAGDIDKVLDACKDAERVKLQPTRMNYEIRACQEFDVPIIARLYRSTFKTYPFPIYEQEYIRKTMESNVDYFCVLSDGDIVGVSAAEMDKKERTVEMTDFAVMPMHRGQRLASALLAQMHIAMSARGMRVAYTIARAGSYSMNLTFARAGYNFGGTLVSNTNIGGQIESMNVWHTYL